MSDKEEPLFRISLNEKEDRWLRPLLHSRTMSVSELDELFEWTEHLIKINVENKVLTKRLAVKRWYFRTNRISKELELDLQFVSFNQYYHQISLEADDEWIRMFVKFGVYWWFHACHFNSSVECLEKLAETFIWWKPDDCQTILERSTMKEVSEFLKKETRRSFKNFSFFKHRLWT